MSGKHFSNRALASRQASDDRQRLLCIRGTRAFDRKISKGQGQVQNLLRCFY
jgi:hypothetical protein